MQIYYISDKYIDQYLIQNKKLQKSRIYDRQYISHHISSHDDIFLYDEKYFDLICEYVSFFQHTSMTITDLKKIILKITHKHNISPDSKYHITDIYVNHTPHDYLFGHKGKISFVVQIYHPKNTPKLRSYPVSRHTIQYINKQKKNYVLLYIHSEIKLIVVKNGFYDGIYTMDLGIDMLKNMIIEEELHLYIQQNSQNPIVNNILSEYFGFHIKQIYIRLSQYIDIYSDIYISSVLCNQQIWYDILVQNNPLGVCIINTDSVIDIADFKTNLDVYMTYKTYF